MAQSITKKITSFKVTDKNAVVTTAPSHEPMTREDVLCGSTYKIKPTGSDHAMYITINDIVHDDGTRRPFEIFINSKHLDSFQYIAVMTRLISAVWRTNGDHRFVVDEMKQIFDPQGGYFLPKGGGFCPSVVAHIGMVIEKHINNI